MNPDRRAPRPGWTGRTGLLAAGLLAAAIVLPLIVPTYYVQFSSKVMLMGILACALNLVVGFGGMVSLCHAAFFGLGGYALALASPQYEPASLWTTLPIAVAVSAAAAFVVGALSLRTRGVYFIMVTLAFGQMLFYLFADNQFAGGSDGAFIYNKPTIALAGTRLVDLDRPLGFYFVSLVLLVVTLLFLGRLTVSPFGRALAAARDNERRARSLGFPIYRIRLTAFTISGALAGLAGYFAAAQFGFVAPQMLGWHLSATVLVMVVLGGLNTLAGPLVGAVALLVLEEILRGLTEHWAFVLGAVIFAAVLCLPGGLRQLLTLLAPARPTLVPALRRAAESPSGV